jgi:hypothetical protein
MLTRSLTRAPILLLLLAPALAPQPSRSRTCAALRVPQTVIDSITLELARDNPDWGAPSSSSPASCISVRSGNGYLIGITITGDDERTGGIALVAPRSRERLFIWPYAAARMPRDVGGRRLLFVYTRVRELMGAGIYESYYLVVCGLSDHAWVPCLELPKDVVHRVFGGPSLPSFEEHNDVRIRGDSLWLRRRAIVEGSAAPRSQDLGEALFILPSMESSSRRRKNVETNRH